jgi:hypothetical protein
VRSRLALGLVPVILAGTALLASPAAAQAASGYTDTGATTYTVNLAKSEIDVTVKLTIKNNTPPKWVDVPCGYGMICSVPEDYYFYDTYMWVPTQAGKVTAKANAGSVSQKVYKSNAYGRELELKFAKLYYGQTRTVTATYVIPAGPRAAGGYRALKAYAGLCASGNGQDSGAVNVVVPDGFTVTFAGGTNMSMLSDTKGVQTYGSGTIAAPYNFFSCVEGSNPSALTSSSVTAADQQFNVQAWPEDASWATAIQADLTADVPKLEDLTGLQMPGGTIAIKEAATDELGEYAGVYNADTKTATVTEDTDNSTVAHELSHIWFNRALFASEWMYEGLAGYSEKVAGPGKFTPCTDAGKYPGTGSANLSTWTYLDLNSTTDDEALADWDYAASCYLVTKLADTMGPAGFKAVIVAASKGQPAYVGGDPTTQAATVPFSLSAKKLLDLVDELGMVPAGVTDPEQAQKLFVSYGILSTSDLAGRSDARDAYHTLLAAAGHWGLPLAVSGEMGDWNFSAAQTSMGTATEILALRDQIAKTLPGFNPDGTALETQFEAAETQADLDAVLTVAQAEADAAKVVNQAAQLQDGSHNPLQAIGLIGTDLAAPMTQAKTDLTQAKPAEATASAQKVIDAVNGSTTQGLVRIAVVLLLLLLALGLLLFVRLRRSEAAALATGDGSLGLPAWIHSGTEPATSVEASGTASPPPAEPPV